jgi:hypothetical protein
MTSKCSGHRQITATVVDDQAHVRPFEQLFQMPKCEEPPPQLRGQAQRPSFLPRPARRSRAECDDAVWNGGVREQTLTAFIVAAALPPKI